MGESRTDLQEDAPKREDERVLGDGEFVARVLEEAENRIRHQLPSERREHEVMKLVETVCKDGEVSREELSSGSRRGPVVQARSLLAGRLVRELGIPQAEAARRLGVTTPAIAKALKRTGSE
jgi:putative transposase